MGVIILKNAERVAAMGAELVGELLHERVTILLDEQAALGLKNRDHYTDKQHVRPH